MGDVKHTWLGADIEDGAYVTPAQWYFPDTRRWLVVRSTREPPSELVAAVRATIWSVDPDQPIVRVELLADLVASSEAVRRFALRILWGFAVLAGLLAGIGLYGVLAAGVAARSREIGVRAALGATRERIVRSVVREGMILAGVGIALGLVAATTTAPVLGSMLFGVRSLDPATYGGVAVLLAAVALLACWAPAVRAARVDPAVTLRTD